MPRARKTRNSKPPPTVAPAEARFVTKRQVAALLQVTVRTIEKWISQDLVPGRIQLPGSARVRFERVAIEEWIANGLRVGATV